MDQKRIDAIKERESKATKGPWRYTTEGDSDDYRSWNWPDEIVSESVTFERYPTIHPGISYPVVVANMAEAQGIPLETGYANADFIAHSRQDIPDLLAEVERLQAENERLSQTIWPNDFPQIVCLCGSTRFWRTFQEAGLKETLAGRIVLSIGAASGTDDDHFGNLPREEYDQVKTMLDELHFRKIEMADQVLILNVGGYIGPSTSRELMHARKLGKVVRYWEKEPDND